MIVVVVVVVVGCWLLVVGCWLLVAGCWLLVAGCWLLVAGCWLLLLLLHLLSYPFSLSTKKVKLAVLKFYKVDSNDKVDGPDTGETPWWQRKKTF